MHNKGIKKNHRDTEHTEIKNTISILCVLRASVVKNKADRYKNLQDFFTMCTMTVCNQDVYRDFLFFHHPASKARFTGIEAGENCPEALRDLLCLLIWLRPGGGDEEKTSASKASVSSVNYETSECVVVRNAG